MANDEAPLRLTDILTTAAAVANYTAAADLTAAHVLDAVEILSGRKTIEDLGRPQSPLVAARRGPAPVAPSVQALARRWFEALGSDVHAELTGESREAFLMELRALTAG